MKKIKKGKKVVRKAVKKTAKRKVVARRTVKTVVPEVVVPEPVATTIPPNDNTNSSETTAAAEGTVAQTQTNEPVVS